MAYEFPNIAELRGDNDLVMVGGDLSPETLVGAYKAGYFPMPLEDDIGWFSPVERAVLHANSFKPSKSLKRSTERFTATKNQRFREVVDRCGDPSRPHGWISEDIKAAYSELHLLGVAHSIEIWNENEKLVGGLYGVHIGSLFAGESMFHSETDASKVALLALCKHLRSDPRSVVDAQWLTPHLASLGFKAMPRTHYARLLKELFANSNQ